jgi:MFS family permease
MRKAHFRRLLILATVTVFTQGSIAGLRPTLSYKFVSLDAPTAWIGIAAAVFAVIPLLLAIQVGNMSDRTDRLKSWMMVAIGIIAVGAAGLLFFNVLWVLLVSSALLGFGHLIFSVITQSYVARFADELLDSSFGWLTACVSLGQFIGPGIMSAVAFFNLNGAFNQVNFDIGTFLVITLIAGVICLVLPSSNPADSAALTQQQQGLLAVVKSIVTTKGNASLLLSSAMLLGMTDLLTVFLPVVGEEVGYSAGFIGLLLALRAIFSFLSRILLQTLIFHFGRRVVLSASLLWSAGLLIALLAGMYLLPEFWAVVISTVLMSAAGFFLGLGQPITMVLISTNVDYGHRGQALSLRLTTNRLGQTVLPIAAAGLSSALGPSVPLVLCAFGLVAAYGVQRGTHALP